jgi:CDP-diacylglycerol--glycerol-3-phosphate 3-phosphatidyltransferase/cardiolipin synthase
VPARFNFPLFLTWLRIVAIPVFVVVLYMPESWLALRNQNLIATVIFVAAAITDWADGYLARRWNMTTSFGAFLDPVADKLMVAAALVVLTHKGYVDAFATLIIIGREITISALREWMAQVGSGRRVSVNIFGKIKTVAQLIAIPFLLANLYICCGIDSNDIGRVLIWIAVVLTLWSMLVYLRAAFWPPKAD